MAQPDGPSETRAGGDEIAAFIAAVEASGVLGKSVRLRDMLHHIVTEEAQGRGERIKAYALATQFLNRGDDFDPQTDSIVRVEFARLRRALEVFNVRPEAAELPLRIDLPKGTYRPVLLTASSAQSEPSNTESATGVRVSAAELPEMVRPPPLSLAARTLFIGLAAIVLMLVVMSIATLLPGRNNKTSLAIGVHQPTMAGLRSIAAGDATKLQLRFAGFLSRYSILGVWTVPAVFNPERSDTGRHDFLIGFDIRRDGSSILVSAATIDPATNQILASHLETEPIWSQSEEAAVSAALERVSLQLGRPFGQLARLGHDALEPESEMTPTDISCYLRLLRYQTAFRRDEYDTAIACYTALAASSASSGRTLAALGMLKIYGARYGFRDGSWQAQLAKVKDLSDKAYADAPDEPVVVQLSYTVALCVGDIQRFNAIIAGELEKDFQVPGMLSDMGGKVALGLNDWERGLELIRAAAARTNDLPVWHRFPLAKEAFDSGNYAAMFDVLQQPGGQNYPEGAMLRLAARLAEGNLEGAQLERRALEAGGVDLVRVHDVLARSCWHQRQQEPVRLALRRLVFLE